MTERRFISPYERRRQLPPAAPRVGQDGERPKRTPYQLGRAFEQAIKGRLERRHYFVMRAAASKGKIDLIATGPVTAAVGLSGLFIQCKRRGEIGSAEWNEVWDIAQEHGGWAVVTTKLSERTVGFYRIDAPREYRSPFRKWTLFEPRDLSEYTPPPTLI